MATEHLRPFHETLVEAIRNGEDIGCLLFLIAATEIPKGHNEIIEATDETWGDGVYWKREVKLARDSLHAQKLVAELKATADL